jgi:hypothetical protein
MRIRRRRIVAKRHDDLASTWLTFMNTVRVEILTISFTTG